MMVFRHCVLSCVAVIACGVAGALAAGGRAATAAYPQARQTQQEAMIFFLAKGEPNACGSGCSEWIAADGVFDPSTPQRLRDILSSLNGRDLPIFFNSPGGLIGDARATGRILREHRMTAGIGKTLPEGCRPTDTAGEPCRQLMERRRELKARLRTANAYCHSACVFAFIGASIRRVPNDARMGIHAGRLRLESQARREGAPTVEQMYLGRKRYVAEMGVDPGLVDVAEKTPFDRLHVLSRNEIIQFGIEPRGLYETPWMLDRTSRRPALLKSVTQAKGPNNAEYRTGVIRVWCEFTGWIMFSYRRELRAAESDVLSTVRLGIGGRDFESYGREIAGELVVSQVFTDLEFFRTAMSADILITESFLPRDAQGRSGTTKLSTTGLSGMLGEWLERCADPKPVSVPSGGVGK